MTMSNYIKSRPDGVLASASRETEKAIAIPINGEKALVWFPKSTCTKVVDDFYAEKHDKWLIPSRMVSRKAAEIGVMAHWIGG